MSNAGGADSSSSMISLHRSMHSSQMYTPGPAISFLTCRWDLPQKLHSSCSFESVGLAISRPRPVRSPRASCVIALGAHAVVDAAFLALLGADSAVALGVRALRVGLAVRVLGRDRLQA